MSDLQTEGERPEHPELFISYASGDLDRAAALHARLVAAGLTVWFDKVRLTPGCDWHEQIEAGCEAARIILPLITRRWAKSEWTRYETYAHDAVIAVVAEGNAEDVMPPPLRRWNAVALDPLAAAEPACRRCWPRSARSSPSRYRNGRRGSSICPIRPSVRIRAQSGHKLRL